MGKREGLSKAAKHDSRNCRTHRQKKTYAKGTFRGQQQRVAIARALINSPDIIFADEPTGNLDSNTGTEIMKLLKEINRESDKTILMVTHSADAAGYGNRIINVRDGVLYQA